MHHRSLIVYCCLLAQLGALSVVARREYFSPYESDEDGKKITRLKRSMYAICLVAGVVIAIAQWGR
jgi:hypothetical protein